MTEIEIVPDADTIRAVTRALLAEANGKELRRDLLRNIRGVLKPAAEEAKRNIRTSPSKGSGGGRASLRQAVAKQVKIQAKLAGKNASIKVKTGKTKDLRGFDMAPRRTNRGTWRHPTIKRVSKYQWESNRDVWVTQHGPTNWFDAPLQHRGPQLRGAVIEAIRASIRRIST